MEAECIAGKVNPPEEIGSTLPHETLAIFSLFVNNQKAINSTTEQNSSSFHVTLYNTNT